MVVVVVVVVGVAAVGAVAVAVVVLSSSSSAVWWWWICVWSPPSELCLEDNYVKVSRQQDNTGARFGNPKIKAS